MNNQYINVGKLVATFGTEGQVLLSHVLGQKTALKGLEVIMIEVRKGDLVPYFVTATKLKNDTEVYITLEDITSKEKAQKIVSKQVWFKEVDYNNFVDTSAAISLLGFQLFDNDVLVGEINEVIEQPHQLLVQVLYKGRNVLLPVHETFIIELDHKQRKITLNLPEGILDL